MTCVDLHVTWHRGLIPLACCALSALGVSACMRAGWPAGGISDRDAGRPPQLPYRKGDLFADALGQPDDASDLNRLDGGRIAAGSVADFSETQGGDGWWYGYYDVGSSQAYDPNGFVEMSLHEAQQWRPPFVPTAGPNHTNWVWTLLAPSQAHPHKADFHYARDQWAVRRWVSSAAGHARIEVMLAKNDTRGGDGVTGMLFVDGLELWRASVDFDDSRGVNASVAAVLTRGARVDLAIAPRQFGEYDASRLEMLVRLE